MFNHEVRIPFHSAHAQISPNRTDENTKNALTSDESTENRSIPREMVHCRVEKKDQKTGTGPIADHGDDVNIQFRRKLRNGTPLDYSRSGHQIVFTIGDNCMDIEALHMGVKGMSVGGERRLVVPACFAYSRRDWEAFFGESDADLEVLLDMKLLRIG